MLQKLSRWLLLGFALAGSSLALAQGCNNRFVAFGDSLTDAGNAYAVLGTVSTPPFSLIPAAPYASHTFSNGATWAERLAKSLSSPDSGAPALIGRGTYTNYAVGGARARPGTGWYDLTSEVSLFLADYGRACPEPTYILWIGGDDLRDALTALASAPSLAEGEAAAGAIITAAVTSIADNMLALAGAGARRFLIFTAPDISHAPAVRIYGQSAITAAAELSAAFNSVLAGALTQLQALPQIHIARYDDNALISAIVADPAAFELRDVLGTCLRFGVVEDAVCDEPSEYLFWDGVHPTAATHRIVARSVRASVLSRSDD